MLSIYYRLSRKRWIYNPLRTPKFIIYILNHWVPQYVRDEIKKKTGVNVDKYGKEIIKKDDMTNIMNLEINLWNNLLKNGNFDR